MAVLRLLPCCVSRLSLTAGAGKAQPGGAVAADSDSQKERKQPQGPCKSADTEDARDLWAVLLSYVAAADTAADTAAAPGPDGSARRAARLRGFAAVRLIPNVSLHF